MSILDTESLWFSAASEFQDSHEGALPLPTVEQRVAKRMGPPEEINVEQLLQSSLLETLLHIGTSKASYMSCWHLNSYESVAMWDLYSSEGKGIAIQSTVQDFKHSIEDRPVKSGSETEEYDNPQELIELGKVEYIDYAEDQIPHGNLTAPLFHKRKSFSHEREFRAVYSKVGDVAELLDREEPQLDMFEDFPAGEPVSINIDQLIEKVYIAPDSPDWFESAVRAVIREFDFDFETQRSSLERDPIF
ncbi:DUF2971 domain-containing protein [Halobaculum marinum]|uniref:DUF2971 domain-containing protein n=1 Tax=Halobaculum marinum TaxID=3031996 RepID=A0ABD5WW38_9EURY|nr:DUF2971 domain-containing protein [Halobaculum sp. DT55]